MSKYKWCVLLNTAVDLDVAQYIARGLERERENVSVDYPTAYIERLSEASQTEDINWNSIDMPHFMNFATNYRLRHIVQKEKHEIDTSISSLQLLRLMMINAQDLLSRGISLRGVIRLGEFMRSRGNEVDYVKLDTWIDALDMRRMANLLGSVLEEFFGFEKDELPFYTKQNKKAKKLVLTFIHDQQKRNIIKKPINQDALKTAVRDQAKEHYGTRQSRRMFRLCPMESGIKTCSLALKIITDIEE